MATRQTHGDPRIEGPESECGDGGREPAAWASVRGAESGDRLGEKRDSKRKKTAARRRRNEKRDRVGSRGIFRKSQMKRLPHRVERLNRLPSAGVRRMDQPALENEDQKDPDQQVKDVLPRVAGEEDARSNRSGLDP